MILWITGISGTGKTTLAKHFLKTFKRKYKNTIFFDGDEFRSIFKDDLKYTIKDRDKNAKRLTSLVRYISNQNTNLIISANLTSNKYRIWCKKNLKNLITVYLYADLKSLLKRDYKKIYKKALQKKIKNVVGVDLSVSKPVYVDLFISNNSTKKTFLNNINKIVKLIKKKKVKIY